MASLRIYVACLAAYTQGVLFGRWIDADQDADDIRVAIAVMLEESPVVGAEEYAIHDYEGFEGIELDEYESIDDVAVIAAGLAEHGEAFAVAYQELGGAEEAVQAMAEQYAGHWDSLTDWAEELASDLLEQVPGRLRSYVDMAAYARDIELSGDVWTATARDGGVHIFWSR